ncbi:MAG: hypothetical protein JKY54_15115, partial [Flavobacteriales bacterium]|nr:hypothetical protein [Flavobacteriales bacterium]
LGFSQGTGTFLVAPSNPYNLTSLSPSSNYDFYVRAICAIGDTSLWSAAPGTFQTACGAIVAPFTETFATTSLPNCWSDDGNDAYLFNTNGGYGAAVAGDHTSGGGTNYAWVDGSGSTGTFDTLTSPPIDVSGLTSATFCFSVFSDNVGDAGNNTINVEFYDGAAWNIVAIIQQNLGAAWVDLSYDLSGFTITGDTYVRFVINTNSTADAYNNDILIDDISINNGGCPITAICIAPALVSTTNITTTSADLSWFENNGATSWQIEWDVAGFTQGTGTFVTTGTNPHNLTGLTENTNYSYYLRTICGVSDSSIIKGPYNFTTLASCPFPSALTAVIVTPTSVDLGWTENGVANAWEIEWDVAGFTQGTGTVTLTGANPHNLSGLSASTSYEFYVRTICALLILACWLVHIALQLLVPFTLLLT